MDFLIDILINMSGPLPYILVFVLLLACGFGLPLPEDITLIAAGLMSYYYICDVWVMLGVCFLGILVGDSTIFMLGVRYGSRLTQTHLLRRLIPPDYLEVVKEKFHRRGYKLLFAARFMPGFRAPIFFSAGALHIPFRAFILYDGLAALLSVPAIVYSIYYFGDELDRVVRVIKDIQHGIMFVIFGVIALVVVEWYFVHRKKHARPSSPPKTQ